MSRRILLIEDDLQMSRLIKEYLNGYGYETVAIDDPQIALKRVFEQRFDIVILDLMLPGIDGFEVCRKIKRETDIPVIISSARGDISNKILGFELGADDYLAKPYEPRELVLRIEAVLRRVSGGEVFRVSDFEVDEASRQITMDGYPIELTRVEYSMFLHLLKNRNRAVSREQLIGVANLPDETKGRSVDMHISNIRQKIGDDPKNPIYIKSVWGIGYKFIG